MVVVVVVEGGHGGEIRKKNLLGKRIKIRSVQYSQVIEYQLPLSLHSICHKGNSSVCESVENAALAPHCISFHHSIHTTLFSTTTPSGLHLCTNIRCIFHNTPFFWPGNLCRDFKDVSPQNCTSTSKHFLVKYCGGIPNKYWKYLGRSRISF